MLLVVLLAAAALPGLAAAEGRAGGTVVVGPNETVRDDLRVTAGTVVVRGTVVGDVSGVAGTVIVAESGNVTDELEVIAGSVRVDGHVGSMSVAAGSVSITETGSVGTDAEIVAGAASVAGHVGGDGSIAADTIVLSESAVVEGDFVYDGELQRASGATVRGQLKPDASVAEGTPVLPDVPGWTTTLVAIAGNVLFGALLLLVFPGFVEQVAHRSREETPRLGAIGLGVLVGVPVVLLLLAVTVVGLPLSIGGLFAFVPLLWASYVLGAYAAGRWALDRAGVEHERERWGALVLGVVFFGLLALVPVVGALARLLVLLIGLGTLAVVLREGYEDYRGEPAA